jgi:enoyl-CoA hydratase/carnithine racemase
LKTLHAQWADSVVEVRLNRPDRRNALDSRMVEELHSVVGNLESKPDRLVLLTGVEDGLFMAGADIDELQTRGATKRRPESTCGSSSGYGAFRCRRSPQ